MRTTLLATVALLAGLAAYPAAAATATLSQLGHVYVGNGKTMAQFLKFGGGVERLGFRAENGNVTCDSIRATFIDGSSAVVYRGYLSGGKERIVDLPQGKNRIDRLDFTCRGTGPLDSSIVVSADIGKYRDQWRDSANWAIIWKYKFPWASQSANG